MNLKKSRWNENLKFNTYLTVQAVLMQFAYTNVTLCAKSWHFPKKSWCLLTCLFSANTKARFAQVDIFSTLWFLPWEILLMKNQEFFLEKSNWKQIRTFHFYLLLKNWAKVCFVLLCYYIWHICHMNELTK